jgi:single-stranded-DNA-specific exonuclease
MLDSKLTPNNNNYSIRTSDKESASALSSHFNISDICSTLLTSRGITDIYNAGKFLYPRLSSMYSPFLFDNMETAVARFRQAIDNKEVIALFSDSDMDGITSLTVIRTLLDSADIDCIGRFPVGDENYGLTNEIIDEVHHKGAKLLITLDCGIRDINEIAYARSLGMDVIVCDHHEQAEILPDAIIIDQKISNSTYPFRELAGAGVAFKMCHALLFSYLPGYQRRYGFLYKDDRNSGLHYVIIKNGVQLENKTDVAVEDVPSFLNDVHSLFYCNLSPDECQKLKQFGDVCIPFEEMIVSHGGVLLQKMEGSLKNNLSLPDAYPADLGELIKEYFFDISFIKPKKIKACIDLWLPLVALGTIADIVPLRDENRIIVSFGLMLFRNSAMPSIASLSNEFGDINVTVVAWKIAPLLNTPGRLGKTDLVADYLGAQTDEECAILLKAIKKLNEERRKYIKEQMDFFTSEIENGNYQEASNFNFILTDRVSDGFTGLVANRIAEFTGKPSIVISDCPGKDILKGSGRAPDGIDFLSYIEPFADNFVRFGGHSRAFGFSIQRSAILDTIRKIDTSLTNVPKEKAVKHADFSADNPAQLVSFFKKEYSMMEPFGTGNEDPLFAAENVKSDTFSAFGTESKHGKYSFSGVSAVGWGNAAEMRVYYENGNKINMLYRIENDPYIGKMRVKIENLRQV